MSLWCSFYWYILRENQLQTILAKLKVTMRKVYPGGPWWPLVALGGPWWPSPTPAAAVTE